MNFITTRIGLIQRVLTFAFLYFLINPHVADDFLSLYWQQIVQKVWIALIGFIGWYKDSQIADAKTLNQLIAAVPNPPANKSFPLAEMKAQVPVTIIIIFFLCSFAFSGCANNPNGQHISAVKAGVMIDPITGQPTGGDVELDFSLPQSSGLAK